MCVSRTDPSLARSFWGGRPLMTTLGIIVLGFGLGSWPAFAGDLILRTAFSVSVMLIPAWLLFYVLVMSSMGCARAPENRWIL